LKDINGKIIEKGGKLTIGPYRIIGKIQNKKHHH
jgi:hypothetical protein